MLGCKSSFQMPSCCASPIRLIESEAIDDFPAHCFQSLARLIVGLQRIVDIFEHLAVFLALLR
ncbi:hypothetical protein PN545_001053 [Cronobacter sakazakii]|nr:hypothetical protein [Cronobacter sakazakii]